MPLYEYKCKACGSTTEKLISHSAAQDDKDFQDCGHCGEAAARIISTSTFELKGNWFKTTGRY